MDWAGEAVAVVPAGVRAAFVGAVRPNCQFPSDIERWAGRLCGQDLRLGEEGLRVGREAGSDFFDRAAEAVARDGASVETIKAATGEKGKRLFMPLRAALTGELHGPELKAVLELLGPERVAARLAACGSKA
jgi:glutamyl-tRNA synthetase